MERRLTPPPNREPKSPRLQAPPGSCDCHFHIFGPQDKFPFPESARALPLDAGDCPLEELIQLQDRLGIDRGVIVQTALYGTSNAVLMDALSRYPDRLRAVAAIDPETPDSELRTMTDAGIVANRFSYVRSPEIDLKLTQKLDRFGWHPQFWFEGEEQALNWRDTMLASPGKFVIDHMGWQPAEKGIDSPGFRVILDCLDTGRCWVKLSGPGRFSAQESLPYSDTFPFAKELIKRAPERLLWGSDWPHPNWWKPMPNDADLLDLFLEWEPDPAVRKRILVDNPAELFGFPPL